MRAAAEAFFRGDVCALECYQKLSGELERRYPGMETKVQKSQISFYDSGLFCCVSLPRTKKGGQAMIVTFGLDAPVPDARIAQAVEPYPNRWTHHVPVHQPSEIDGQLLAWIDWSHAFTQNRRTAGRKRHESNGSD